ncbi:MAG: hypothetical protein J6252_03415 [Clostridia bacterium]|nr:hypothetical protein [Clostridia bacterium]
MYYECRNGTTAYNLPLLFPLAGFDREKLLAGVKTFFELHPCLFTRFALDEDGNVKKHIVKTGIDVGYFEAESVEKVPVTHFEMLESPLYRVAFCRVGGEEYLFCDFHHAIFDGASVAIFLRDVLRICDGESLLPERKDANGYALWEAEERASPRYEEAKNYFASAFGGSECSASVPEDKKDEKVCWKSYKKPLGVTRDEVSAFVKKTGCKTSSLFLAAFGYLLSRMNMEHEALFSTVQNGRNAENEGAAGMFVRTVPFRLNFPNGAKIKDILLEATEEQIKLAENRVYSFADATRDLGISSDVIFAYQGDYFCKTVYHGKELGLIQPPVEDGKSGVTAEVYRDGDGFFFRCEYRADLYTDFTAESILRLYGIILKEFMRRETLDETDITGEAELAVLDAQNESPGYAPDTEHTVIDYFEKHAKEQPEHPLVSFGDRTYTYAGADAISASLSAKLSSLGIGREDVV